MPAAVVKDGTVTPKFRQGKISPPFLTAKFSPQNSPLAKSPPPVPQLHLNAAELRPRCVGTVCRFVAGTHMETMTPPPPPPCPTTGQVLVQGAKVRKHGVPVFGQARVTARHVPWETSCRHNQNLPTQTTTKGVQQSGIHPRTQEHMELQLHQHIGTRADPSCSLPKATNHILCWTGTAETMGPKKPPPQKQSGETRGRRVRTKGGGVV